MYFPLLNFYHIAFLFLFIVEWTKWTKNFQNFDLEKYEDVGISQYIPLIFSYILTACSNNRSKTAWMWELQQILNLS